MQKSNSRSVAIIGTVGIPAIYGGFETLTEYLTKYIGDKLEFTVVQKFIHIREKR